MSPNRDLHRPRPAPHQAPARRRGCAWPAALAPALALALWPCDSAAQQPPAPPPAPAAIAAPVEPPPAPAAVSAPVELAPQPAAVATATAGVPDIEFEAPDFDFVEASPNQEIVHRFVFKNVGTAPLIVSQVRASCGCTATTLTRGEVEPGGTGEIEARLRVPVMSGPTTKTITVTSNDPDEPSVTLSMKGKVVREIEVLPTDRVNFGRVTAEQADERRLQIQPSTDRKLKITDVNIQAPDFDVELVTVKEDMQYELIVRTKKGLAGGLKRGTVTLTTDAEKMPTLEIPIMAYLAERIGVTPEQLIIRPRRVGEQRGYLFVRSYDNKPFKVTGVDAPWEGVQVSHSSLNNDQIWRILVSYEAKDSDPTRRGEIVVHTDDPQFAAIKVPVIVYAYQALPQPGLTPAPGVAPVPGTARPTAAPRPPRGPVTSNIVAVPPVPSESAPPAPPAVP